MPAVLAGLGGMEPLKVLTFSSLSALLWNGLVVYAGFLLGANWEAVRGVLRAYTLAVGGLLGAIFLLWLGSYILRRRRKEVG